MNSPRKPNDAPRLDPETGGRTYWRSLDQLAGDSPEYRSFLEREFPEGASELPEGIPRRQMLMLLGASLSLAGIAGCRRPVEQIVPYVTAPEEVIPGIPRRYATTMPFGRNAYGLIVESHEGRPTKIEGNPLHPASGGATSALMQASILDLYDPDRSRSVLHRGEPATWDAFVSFWQGLHAQFEENGGAGLAVLSESFASPTLARLARAVRAKFPDARWATWDAVGLENPGRGVELATGTAYRAVPVLDKASVILSIDADFLLCDPDNVANAGGFARGRRVRTEADTMNRLYVAESRYSTTGAMADHRMRLRSGQMGALVAALGRELRSLGLAVEAPAGSVPEGADPGLLATLARDLFEHRGSGLILAGPEQPAEVHAAVLGLNAALGNVGRTVTYHEPVDAMPSSAAELAALTSAMRAGEVGTLVILGGNPLYAAPADLDFAAALGGVEHAIHLASHVDETSSACEWQLPQTHYLEAWGDCRAAEGTASVTQPLIEPLFGAHSAVELLALVESGEPRAGYDEVRATWTAVLGEAGFEKKWRRVLHDGLLEGSSSPGVTPTVAAGAPAGLALRPNGGGSDDLEIAFRPSPVLWDGRFANNGWLQELPDAVTKLTWDNPALLSPATMQALGLVNGDMARLRHEGREIELPVWAVPGQADWTVQLALGYGRAAAGRVGSGVGFNAFGLRTSAAPDIAGGATLGKTGGKHVLASTQNHGSMEGRPIVREATLDEYRRRPEFAREMVEMPPLEQMIADHDYQSGYQWGMSIDLNVCTGCNACVTACQSENNVPIVGKQQVLEGREMHWLRVDRYFSGSGAAPEAAPEMVVQPVPCMHCENAPCEQVCPVAATVHDGEGLNVMVYNRCIGTRYCSNNCPYKVRRFNFFNYTRDTAETVKMAQNPDVTVRSRGVMEKCTYCTQRIASAKIDAKLDGREVTDGEIRTACEQACPTGAIVFGNIRDPESRVSRMKRNDRNYALLAELNNRPRTTFLAKLRNPHPDHTPAPAMPMHDQEAES